MGKKTRRRFLEESLFAAAAAATLGCQSRAQPAPETRPSSRSEILRVGVVGVRGRGNTHVDAFVRSKDSEVVAICDPDSAVVGKAMGRAPKAKLYRDLRKLLEDESIDVISIATPNHWHTLATLWALQAGKHVYVEKPLSHNLHEGRILVEAARKTGRLIQHGTQARSARATQEAIAWMQAGGIGKVKLAQAFCYKRRKSIGKVKGPQQPPKTLDYELWTGPAPMAPLARKHLHYDWHWLRATGNGDIGNQGVHQMDIARWGLGQHDHPTHISSCGARLGYDDDGDTANTEIADLDYGDARIIFEVRGLETKPHQGVKIGVIFHGEGGYLVSTSHYSKMVALDHKLKPIKTWEGGGNHFQNFIDAVKAGRPQDLHADAQEGHLSSSLCHLANLSQRIGSGQLLNWSDTPFGNSEAANESFRRMRQHLADNGLEPNKTAMRFGPTLAFDSKAERFRGFGAAQANPQLTRRYRAPFIVPEKV